MTKSEDKPAASANDIRDKTPGAKPGAWIVLAAVFASLCAFGVAHLTPGPEQTLALGRASYLVHHSGQSFPNAAAVLSLASTPAIILSRTLHWAQPITFNLLTLLLALFSSFLCWRFLPSSRRGMAAASLYVLTILAIFLLLPERIGRYQGFGGSENLLLILTLPYVLMRINNRPDELPGLTTRTAASVMAGVGFSLKPGFVLAWAVFELYLARTRGRAPWRQRKFLVTAGVVLLGLGVALMSPAAHGFANPSFTLKSLLHVPLIDAPGSALDIAILLIAFTILHCKAEQTESVRGLLAAAVGFLAAALITLAVGDCQLYAVIALGMLTLMTMGVGCVHEERSAENDGAVSKTGGAETAHHSAVMKRIVLSVACLWGVLFLVWSIGQQRGFPFMDAVAIPDLTPLKCMGMYALVQLARSSGGVSKSAETLVLRALIVAQVGYISSVLFRTLAHATAPENGLILFSIVILVGFVAHARSTGALNHRLSQLATGFALAALLVMAGGAALFAMHSTAAPSPNHPGRTAPNPVIAQLAPRGATSQPHPGNRIASSPSTSSHSK